jgi:hypothetical protein
VDQALIRILERPGSRKAATLQDEEKYNDNEPEDEVGSKDEGDGDDSEMEAEARIATLEGKRANLEARRTMNVGLYASASSYQVVD